MARGWESKSVEDQQADWERAPVEPRPTVSAADVAAAARASARRTLELARARAADDLRTATREAHRAMLREALRALDAQLADRT
jgi:hypothetical protein